MFPALLSGARADLDAAWMRWQPRLAWHPQLNELATHVVLGGGKAFRPALLAWAYQNRSGNNGRPPEPVADLALALELIHTYSLVHDDLPCMDDDDFRRGRPTVHRLAGDALAVLTGDTLLTGAFEIVGLTSLSDSVRSRACLEFARAAGGAGMIAGQVRDIGRDAFDIGLTHRLKTGALFAAALVVGEAATSQAPDTERTEALRAWGFDLGQLFQVADDVLDATADRATLGKTPGKDERDGVPGYVTLHGLDGARRELERLRTKLSTDARALGFASDADSLIEAVSRRSS